MLLALKCYGIDDIISGINELSWLLQDLVHHYDQHSPANKLESHIYAIVLLFCLQNHYRSDLLWTEDSLSQVYMTFIFRDYRSNIPG